MLDLAIIKRDIDNALIEDVGRGDYTSQLIPEEQLTKAIILTREPMLVCGQPWVEAAFKSINEHITIDWKVIEGSWLAKPQILCQLMGKTRDLLTAERTALNFFQFLSAVATKTYHYVEKVKDLSVKILDTRKTLPNLRYSQKYAVRIGGGQNHRFGLYDAILIKENHIKACGSIPNAIETARKMHPNLLIEIEVENLSQLEQALDSNPDRILLDNFIPQDLIKAVSLRNKLDCTLEVSGGINLNNVRDYAMTGIDFISVGDLTKSIQAIDLSLLIT